jgi:serine/threonine-protein kinase
LYQIPSRRAEAPSAYKKAVEILSQRLEVNPKDVSALAMSADYYAMLDQEMEARRHLASALAIEPSDPDVLFRGAILYNHIGDTTKTLEFLRRAVDAGCSRTQVRDTPDFDHLRGDKRFDSFLPPTYSR